MPFRRLRSGVFLDWVGGYCGGVDFFVFGFDLMQLSCVKCAHEVNQKDDRCDGGFTGC